uniref:Nickel/cobalt efflux system n=1 Tax=Globisporangium ultimum (strain ATCC 200006 / CBS 805.95 / DAOM BR144) TaxID=431595 RepID=K3X5J3_GLOUD
MNASLGKIIITAVCLGVVHILTGPDHLGALAALSSGRSWRAAFALGLQWGCGHSVGILSVAAICLGIGHALNLGGGFRALWNYATGAFLVAIGLWTLYDAKTDFEVQTKPVSKWSYVECHDKTYYQTQLSPKSNKTSGLCGSFWPQGSQQQEEEDSKTNQKKTQQSATAVSVCVGLFHGVAGPGGVLGILPVLAMQHDDGDGAVLLHAVVYLACFCLSSMLCMGIFAALYGELTHRVATNARRQPSATKIQSHDSDSEDKKHAAALITFRVAMASSLLSILVGIAWLVLQACGVLDHVFGHNHHGE